MFRTVLVPLDGSSFGELALPLAMSIARRAGATLRLVRVDPPLADHFFWAPMPSSPLEAELREQFRVQANAYLENVGQRLASAGAGPMTLAVLDGEVAESLRLDIDREGADLVVMTSHGRGTLGRVWLGSVADELVRSLTVPLLLVRPREGETVPDVTRDTIFRHLLLAVDGTSLSERILAPALAIGSLMKADYTLVRVISAAVALNYTPEAAGYLEFTPAVTDELEKIRKRLFGEAEQYLQQLAERLRAGGAKVTTRVVVADQPVVGILQEADGGADLIALETHGRHGLSRLLMGSVADKVVRGSTLPVLICRG